MEFEADPAKAAQNLKKHKVGFEEAASGFWGCDGLHLC